MTDSHEFTIYPTKGNIFAMKTHGFVREVICEYIQDAFTTAKFDLIADLRKAQEDPVIIKEIDDIKRANGNRECDENPYEGDKVGADSAWAPSIKESLHPVFVLEIAYTEISDSLHNKAQKRVQGIGSIRWVLGVKLYPATAPGAFRAELWLWQARNGRNGSRYPTQVQYKVRP